MAKDDYFRVVFCILKAAYEYKKAHMRFDEGEISPAVIKLRILPSLTMILLAFPSTIQGMSS